MAQTARAVIEQIDVILSKCSLKSRKGYDDFSDLPKAEVSEAVNLAFAAIQRLAPSGSSYAENAQVFREHLSSNVTCGRPLPHLIGILQALRFDYESGYLESVQELIHADMFADFLEMAEYLLKDNFKDPAAVIAGSVLEEHLRKLCDKNKIGVTKDLGGNKAANTLNTELFKNGVYSTLDQKSVTAWQDLRNKAAHGYYKEYTKDQVALMLQGIRDFVTRHSA